MRADVLLVKNTIAPSRAKARRWIDEGRVYYQRAGDWRLVGKPGLLLPPDTVFKVLQDESDAYVSRGALKLKAALEHIGLDVTGMTALDVGASTGGFTDYLLQSGAAKVVCVDVGHDQLAAKLRNDSRVINYEGINARKLDPALCSHTTANGFDLAVMDVSFISQRLIIPSLTALLAPGAYLVSLVKPQFEVGRSGVGKGGIVRDTTLYKEVEQTLTQVYQDHNLDVSAYLESPISGGDGNREFLIIARNCR